MSLDRRMFDLLHHRAGELGTLDAVLLGCARHGAAAEVLLMLLIGVCAGGTGRGALLRCLAAVACLYPCCELLGALAARKRPFADHPGVPLIAHGPHRSFPSRHVASAMAMAMLVRPASRWAATLMGLITLGLGVGRVRAGLHYPSDVVAGAGLGYAAAIALRKR